MLCVDTRYSDLCGCATFCLPFPGCLLLSKALNIMRPQSRLMEYIISGEFERLQSEVQRQNEVIHKLRAANKKLRLRVQTSSRVLSSQKKQLRFLSSKSYQTSIIRKKLLSKFSMAQTSILLNNRRQARQWSEADIADALVLRACSKKTYLFLRKKKLLPLPG